MSEFDKILPSILQIGGTTYSAAAQRKAGALAQAAKNFEADQLDALALAEEAAGQRIASDKRELSKYVQSQTVARAAASGTAVSGDVLDTLARLATRGKYQSDTELYNASMAAQNARLRGAAARVTGANAAQAGQNTSMATLLSGLGKSGVMGSLFDNFGRFNRPETASTSIAASMAPAISAMPADYNMDAGITQLLDMA
jgi:hypothetical protein